MRWRDSKPIVDLVKAFDLCKETSGDLTSCLLSLGWSSESEIR